MPLARNFEFAKTPRGSFLAGQDLLPGAPDAFIHLIRSIPQIRGLWLLVRGCAYVEYTGTRGIFGGRAELAKVAHKKNSVYLVRSLPNIRLLFCEFRPISTTPAPQIRALGSRINVWM